MIISFCSPPSLDFNLRLTLTYLQVEYFAEFFLVLAHHGLHEKSKVEDCLDDIISEGNGSIVVFEVSSRWDFFLSEDIFEAVDEVSWIFID